MVDVLNWISAHIIPILLLCIFFGGTVVAIVKGIGGCGDSIAHHEHESVDPLRPCRAQVRTAVGWDVNGKPNRWDRRKCTCTHYVGPEPLPLYYAPDITGQETS